MNSNFLKKAIVFYLFITTYAYTLLTVTGQNDNINIIFGKLLVFIALFICIIFIYIIYFLFKKRLLYATIFIKIIIFTIVISFYFIIEQSIIKLFLYNIGDSGGYIRNNIFEDTFYQFQWYEVLFWNFIFSLHYPIYIFIFFKPFVNHLDKSIRKIKEDKKQ